MVRIRLGCLLLVVTFLGLVSTDASSAPIELSSGTHPQPLRAGLNLRAPGLGYFARRLLPGRDPVSNEILRGNWQFPVSGEQVEFANEAAGTWKPITSNDDGVFERLRGYFAVQVNSPRDAFALLEASGHSIAYVNGVPHTGGLHLTFERVGTPTPVPIALRRGKNDLVFRGRGIGFRANLVFPEDALVLSDIDTVLPDVVLGEHGRLWGAVLVLNVAAETSSNLTIAAQVDSAQPVRTPLASLPPLGARKIPFQFEPPEKAGGAKVEVKLQLIRGDNEIVGEQVVTVNRRAPQETRKCTFRSRVDGSVQYYAVKPATPLPGTLSAPAIVLSLHGAGVQAVNQANSYAAKSWAHIVAPTNRRPYGYNWEFLGQIDALEVLEDARGRFPSDRSRTYLTGHSMGGHGTWHVGQTFPDHFAAIAPSAGWVAMGRYGSRGRRLPENPSRLDLLMQRPANPNDSDALLRNTEAQAIYILHGSEDRSVPVAHAQYMSEALAPFHRDFTYYEQPEVGHWWDESPAAGVDCVDWLPMFELFTRRRLPVKSEVRKISFVTANPGRSASSHWVTVEDQIRALDFSSVEIQCDPVRRMIHGSTENVRRLGVELTTMAAGDAVTVVLDGQEFSDIEWPSSGRLVLAQQQAKWGLVETAPLHLKGPHRYGPFRAAFDNQFMIVYGTQGTADENASTLAKVRYDCETYWVGGNGSVEVIADAAFDPEREPNRNVILFGNSDTNSAWKKLLAHSPVQVRRGGLSLGDRILTGEELACTFIYPRPGSDRALVGAVATSGVTGVIPTYHLGYLGPSVDYPDCTVWNEAGEVLAAGFFGSDWSVEGGEFEINSSN